jgi:hypothetical protein
MTQSNRTVIYLAFWRALIYIKKFVSCYQRIHHKFIAIVKKTFRWRNVFLLQPLMTPSFIIRNVVMTSGINSYFQYIAVAPAISIHFDVHIL